MISLIENSCILSGASAFNLFQHAVLVEIHEENQASSKYVKEKGRSIFTAFSDKGRYSFLILHKRNGKVFKGQLQQNLKPYKLFASLILMTIAHCMYLLSIHNFLTHWPFGKYQFTELSKSSKCCHILFCIYLYTPGLPSQLSQSRICLQCRGPGFNSQVGKMTWRRKWQPTPVFLPGEYQEQKRLAGYSIWGRKSQT